MTSSLRKFVRVAVVMLVLSAASTPAWSQDFEPGAAKEGGFVGVSFLPQFTFDGITFDGETFYKEIDGDEMMFLPRVDSQRMFRGILGYRARQASLELSYERSKHFGTFVDVPLNATFQAFNVDGRLFFLPTKRVQPSILVGGVYPMLTITDGSFLIDRFADARFNGYGVNTEAGVTVYPIRSLGINVGYAYRILWFDRVKGVSDKLFELKPKFRETSGSLVITANFVL
jgi:hypothetical protein